MADTRLVNVTDLIDERPMSALQIITITMCGLVNVLDGMDTQSIGVAAPLIANALAVKVSSFGPIFAAALLGATVGALCFGPIADRVGRKLMLALATFLFGTFTLLTAHADSYQTLLIFRFLAGIGLGGATPCFLTLTSEYAPKRLRATLVGMLWAFFPLGGMIGGFLNAWILHNFGWRTVFWVGGSLPFLVGLLVLLLVPESARFLMARGKSTARVARIVRRMFPDAATAETRFTAREEHIGGISVTHLFTDGRAIGTLLLWVPLFTGFAGLAVAVLWTPTLLNMAGISPGTASMIIGITGLGGFIGNGLSGRMLDRFGIFAVPVPCLLGGAVALVGYGYFAGNVAMAALCGFLTNGLIGLGMTSAIVIASTVYPTAIRSTGVGWAMAMGRGGQVLAPLVTGMTLAWGWSATGMMALIAVGPVLGAVAMVLLHLHLAGRPTDSWASVPAAEG
jgi:AAHS family 4-hydroxybenzoate transporter-like MFS transporter